MNRADRFPAVTQANVLSKVMLCKKFVQTTVKTNIIVFQEPCQLWEFHADANLSKKRIYVQWLLVDAAGAWSGSERCAHRHPGETASIEYWRTLLRTVLVILRRLKQQLYLTVVLLSLGWAHMLSRSALWSVLEFNSDLRKLMTSILFGVDCALVV